MPAKHICPGIILSFFHGDMLDQKIYHPILDELGCLKSLEWYLLIQIWIEGIGRLQ